MSFVIGEGSVNRVAQDAEGHTYGAVARSLHWITFVALTAQFTIGYALDGGGGRGRGRGRGRGESSGRGRGRGGDDFEAFGDDQLATLHVVLGVTIIAISVIRLLWRRYHGLPPWAATLRKRERTLAHWTERSLYALLFAVPLTGLALVFVSDDLLGLHIAGHLALYAAFAVHVGLVLKHQFIDRDRLLRRML